MKDWVDVERDYERLYNRWRHGLKLSDRYSLNFDQVELRRDPRGKLRPAALIETTGLSMDDGQEVLDAIWRRLDPAGPGNLCGEVLAREADERGIPALIVAYREDMSEFHLRPLTTDTGRWYRVSSARYVEWLANLRL